MIVMRLVRVEVWRGPTAALHVATSPGVPPCAGQGSTLWAERERAYAVDDTWSPRMLDAFADFNRAAAVHDIGLAKGEETLALAACRRCSNGWGPQVPLPEQPPLPTPNTEDDPEPEEAPADPDVCPDCGVAYAEFRPCSKAHYHAMEEWQHRQPEPTPETHPTMYRTRDIADDDWPEPSGVEGPADLAGEGAGAVDTVAHDVPGADPLADDRGGEVGVVEVVDDLVVGEQRVVAADVVVHVGEGEVPAQ